MRIFRFMSIEEFQNYLKGQKIEGKFVKGKACFLEKNIPARELEHSIKQLTDITSLDFKTNNFEEQIKELNELISSNFKDGNFKGELKEFENLTLSDFMSKVRQNASAEVLVEFETTEKFEENCEKLILPYGKYLIEEIQSDGYSMDDLECISYKIDLMNRFKNGIGIDTIPENEFKDVEQTLETLKKAKIAERLSNDEKFEEKFTEIGNEIINNDKDMDLSFILEGIEDMDVSQIDINILQENFKRTTFDSKTKFSQEQIEKYHPKELLEEGKKFSDSMERLYKKGIDGRGTKIAIIDSCFDSKIEEFEDRVIQQVVFEKKDGNDFISHREYKKEDGDGFHGKTTASLAVGKECGIAPKAEVYLFGIAEGTDWAEAKEAILKYMLDNDINVDIISMSADTKNSEQTIKMLKELEEKGCPFLDSSGFWKDFSWGRTSEDGTEVVQDELMKTISELPCDENSRGGKVIKNLNNTVLIPCTGRTSLQTGKERVYKYNGSVCGASFAIPQVAALFAIARQIDPSIKLNEFIGIIKNPERLNSEGMMYVDPEEMVEKLIEKSKTNERTQEKKEKELMEMYKDEGINQTDLEEVYSILENQKNNNKDINNDNKTIGDD